MAEEARTFNFSQPGVGGEPEADGRVPLRSNGAEKHHTVPDGTRLQWPEHHSTVF